MSTSHFEVPKVAQKSPHVRCRSCAQRYIWPGACEPLYPPYKPFCPGLGHALPQDGGPVLLPEMIDFKGFRVHTASPTKMLPGLGRALAIQHVGY